MIALALLFALAADCNVKPQSIPDGDTFYAYTLRVIAPDHGRVEWTRFRLKDVYAPERGEKDYAQAKADLSSLVSGRVRVDILPDRDPRGGLIVEVYRCDGEHVNAAMRAKGWTSFGRR
jgi:endonuclease YncB( thermonuclease family)